LTKPAKKSEIRQALCDTLSGLPGGAISAGAADQCNVATKRLRILLAEDCIVNQEVAIGLLELREHEVEVANNGREAVDVFREKPFDLVLMDVEMPEMDGLEATRIIRQVEASTQRRTPIIAMTAHAVRGVPEACMAAGMDDYLPKPIDPNKLYRLIDEASSAPSSQ
jgi:CheY-like chemotaxis protein